MHSCLRAGPRHTDLQLLVRQGQIGDLQGLRPGRQFQLPVLAQHVAMFHRAGRDFDAYVLTQPFQAEHIIARLQTTQPDQTVSNRQGLEPIGHVLVAAHLQQRQLVAHGLAGPAAVGDLHDGTRLAMQLAGQLVPVTPQRPLPRFVSRHLGRDPADLGQWAQSHLALFVATQRHFHRRREFAMFQLQLHRALRRGSPVLPSSSNTYPESTCIRCRSSTCWVLSISLSAKDIDSARSSFLFRLKFST